MAPTNVQYASGFTDLESLVLHILPYQGEHGDGISNTNFLWAALKQRGMYERITGGLENWEGVLKANSSNAKTQGKNEDMTADTQDPCARLRFDWKIITSSVVLNELDEAMNQGSAAVKKWLMTLREQGKISIENLMNSLSWAANPGANDIESLPSLISATPTAGTIGGLSRSGNAYLQNGAYTTAITDIGSEAGIGKMIELQAKYAVGQSMADLMILPHNLWAGLAGYLATEKRFKADEQMAQLKIKTIEVGDALVGFENTNVMNSENTITSTYLYGINSKYMKIRQLLHPRYPGGWGNEFERLGTKLNRAVFYRWFGALTTNNPRAHFVATSVAST